MLVLAPRLSSGTGVGMMTLSAEVRQTYGAHWGNGLGLQACTINKSVPTAIGGPNSSDGVGVALRSASAVCRMR